MTVTIVWLYTFMSASGPVTEARTFDSVLACQSFGQTMSPRTAAFVRNAFKLDASVDIRVAFQCRITGLDV